MQNGNCEPETVDTSAKPYSLSLEDISYDLNFISLDQLLKKMCACMLHALPE